MQNSKSRYYVGLTTQRVGVVRRRSDNKVVAKVYKRDGDHLSLEDRARCVAVALHILDEIFGKLIDDLGGMLAEIPEFKNHDKENR